MAIAIVACVSKGSALQSTLLAAGLSWADCKRGATAARYVSLMGCSARSCSACLPGSSLSRTAAGGAEVPHHPHSGWPASMQSRSHQLGAVGRCRVQGSAHSPGAMKMPGVGARVVSACGTCRAQVHPQTVSSQGQPERLSLVRSICCIHLRSTAGSSCQ